MRQNILRMISSQQTHAVECMNRRNAWQLHHLASEGGANARCRGTKQVSLRVSRLTYCTHIGVLCPKDAELVPGSVPRRVRSHDTPVACKTQFWRTARCLLACRLPRRVHMLAALCKLNVAHAKPED